MLRIEIRFPLGVYHALSAESFERPEWPPSPVRLVGALLAATHESEAIETEPGREVLDLICAADPPQLVAPQAKPFTEDDVDGSTVLAEIRGASRWAPRNRAGSELKKGLSFRQIGGQQTEVFKGGTVVGDRPIEVRWPELDLDDEQMAILRRIAEEVTFLGTSRSPAIMMVKADMPDELEKALVWQAVFDFGPHATEVRVPTPSLLSDFDRRHKARRATGKKSMQKTGYIPNVGMGSTIAYLPEPEIEALFAEGVEEQTQWGDMLILELDTDQNPNRESSELWPSAGASYLVARAFRRALLDTYGPIGTPDEAPPVLRGRGSEPHAAFIPLPHVGAVATQRADEPAVSAKTKAISADGLIRGIAVVLPHESRMLDVLEQRLRVEDGLRRFVLGDNRQPIQIPGAGRLFLKLPSPTRRPLKTLEEPLYRGPSRVWQTVTPIVHARRKTSTGPRGIERQIAADCAFAGLPEPIRIEVLKDAPFPGAPDMPLPARSVPPDWRASMTGPHSHLRLTFARAIEGPVLLGRAAHFGLGLCRPAPGLRSDSILVSRENTPEGLR